MLLNTNILKMSIVLLRGTIINPVLRLVLNRLKYLGVHVDARSSLYNASVGWLDARHR